MTILIAFLVLVICATVLVWIVYFYFINRGAVYYPTTVAAANKVLDLSKLKKGELIMDLGCGDGVVLIEAAKRGIKGIGYELDPLLVFKTRKKIKELGLEDLIEIRQKNMYEANFQEAKVLYFYQFPKYLRRFDKILNKKLSTEKLAISNRYQFPNRKYFERKDKIFLYKFPHTE